MFTTTTGAPIASTAEFSSYVIVHQDHAGFVIGSGGATIQDIAKKTNTWIHIQPVNEWSFGHPWFLIKGRSEDVVAKAHHYILTISNEAESRNPKWSVPLQMELESDDLAHIDEFYSTADTENLIAKEFENCPDHEFNAALTDFECKDLDARIDAETSTFLYEQLPPCFACEQGIENQKGHYGACIPDPCDVDQTVRARAVGQLEHPLSDAKFWSNYEEEGFCFEHHNADKEGGYVACDFCFEQEQEREDEYWREYEECRDKVDN